MRLPAGLPTIVGTGIQSTVSCALDGRTVGGRKRRVVKRTSTCHMTSGIPTTPVVMAEQRNSPQCIRILFPAHPWGRNHPRSRRALSKLRPHYPSARPHLNRTCHPLGFGSSNKEALAPQHKQRLRKPHRLRLDVAHGHSDRLSDATRTPRARHAHATRAPAQHKATVEQRSVGKPHQL